MKFYLIIFMFFLIFIIIQIYYYSGKLNKFDKKISDIESFKNTLNDINNQNDYYLDDASLELLLDDYHKLIEKSV